MNSTFLIPGIVLVLLGVGIFVVGQQGLFDDDCSGWNALNPFCQIGKLVDATFKVLSLIGAIILVILGVILMMIQDASQLKYFVGFSVIGIGFIINMFIPDPIPFVDEIFMGIITLWLGVKSVSPESKPGKMIGMGF